MSVTVGVFYEYVLLVCTEVCTVIVTVIVTVGVTGLCYLWMFSVSVTVIVKHYIFAAS